jgi:magnesium chelatase family protein
VSFCTTLPHGRPCGYYSDPQRDCRFTGTQIQRYRNKISGPLLDHIDIHVEVPSVRYHELTSLAAAEPSTTIRERVIQARTIQQHRFAHHRRVHCNAEMGAKKTPKFCRPEKDAQDMLKMAITDLNFSARAYDRVLKVARTIADLAGHDTIGIPHIAEAIQFRSLDRQLWT